MLAQVVSKFLQRTDQSEAKEVPANVLTPSKSIGPGVDELVH